MSRKHKAAGRATADSAQPTATPAAGAAGSPPLIGKRPMLRFVAIFAALIIPFNILYYAYYEHSSGFHSYLSLNASASAAVLRCFGTLAQANDLVVRSPLGGITVAQGCDAVQPTALFLCAVLASPVALRRKLPGIAIGVPLLLFLNLVRIVTLFYTKTHFPAFFDMMHLDVWQAAFIFLALLLWITWARWAIGRTAVRTHVSA